MCCSASGLVYRAVTPDGLEVAIKKIPLSKDSMVTIQNEIDMMRSAECPYFVQLIDEFYVEEEDEMWVSFSRDTIHSSGVHLRGSAVPADLSGQSVLLRIV